MDNSKTQPEIIFSKSNVCIHPSKDEAISGNFYLLKDRTTKEVLMAWSPNNSTPGTNTTVSNDLYAVKVPLKDINSMKRYTPALGVPHLTVITKSGVAFPPYYFNEGGVRELVHTLQSIVNLVRSDEDPNIFYVQDLNNNNPIAFKHSYEKPKELKAIENVSWSILEGFSKVTQFARNVSNGKIMKDESPKRDRKLAFSDIGTWELLLEEKESLPKIERMLPLTKEEWESYFDIDGRITNEVGLRKRIFYGGVHPSIRPDVWKFLLHYYPFNSTFKEREEIVQQKKEKYLHWKNLWTTLYNEADFKFSKLKMREHGIEKDVLRTDRVHEFYKGPENLAIMMNILNVYCLVNFDLGYVQGMNELLAPILFNMKDEIDSFWCFKGLMDQMESNFHKDQNGMHRQITNLSKLIKTVDSQLYAFLESHDCLNFFYCFRWLLIIFKREFSFDNIQKLWDVLWSQHLTPQFHLFMAAAILIKHRKTIISEDMYFDDLLKFTNDMAGQINLNEVLIETEQLYYAYQKLTNSTTIQ